MWYYPLEWQQHPFLFFLKTSLTLGIHWLLTITAINIIEKSLSDSMCIFSTAEHPHSLSRISSSFPPFFSTTKWTTTQRGSSKHKRGGAQRLDLTRGYIGVVMATLRLFTIEHFRFLSFIKKKKTKVRFFFVFLSTKSLSNMFASLWYWQVLKWTSLLRFANLIFGNN